MNGQAPVRQQRLMALLGSASGAIRISDAMAAWGMDRPHAAKLLAAWHRQGVLRRIARGLYVPVSPATLGRTQVLEDPRILVPELYDPGYVGGWSALEHWELTEQLFRSICVLTTKRVTRGRREHQGVEFFIKRIPANSLFGTQTLWRDNVKIQISDPARTVLDIIDDPYLGAGLQHTFDCLTAFWRSHEKPEELCRLIEYADRLGKGSLFKKLGFLAECLGAEQSFIETCATRLTLGNAYLDKSSQDNRLVTRWRLWAPRGFEH